MVKLFALTVITGALWISIIAAAWPVIQFARSEMARPVPGDYRANLGG